MLPKRFPAAGSIEGENMVKYKKSAGSIAFDVFNIVLMLFIVFCTVYPFWYVVVGSLNDSTDFLKGGIFFWPRKWSLLNYKEVFANDSLVNAFGITIARTVLGIVTHVIFTGIFAYGMAYKNLMGKKFYSIVCIIPMFIGGGTIPCYLLLVNLKLTNTFWVYIIPWLFSFWDSLILRMGFNSIPDSLFESARIEGAGEIRIFWHIAVPLTMPIFAAIAIFTGVGQWNSYFDSLLYNANTDQFKTLQHLIVEMIKRNEGSTGNIGPGGMPTKVTSESLQYASIVVATLPIVVIYPFLQRFFVKGVLIGAVKE